MAFISTSFIWIVMCAWSQEAGEREPRLETHTSPPSPKGNISEDRESSPNIIPIFSTLSFLQMSLVSWVTQGANTLSSATDSNSLFLDTPTWCKHGCLKHGTHPQTCCPSLLLHLCALKHQSPSFSDKTSKNYFLIPVIFSHPKSHP